MSESKQKSELEAIRKSTIPTLITKYQKLIDEIFDAAGNKLPKFKDLVNEETGEVNITAEQQLFSFIQTRNSALDNANNILEKVNMLERELNDPEFKKKKDANSEELAPTSKPHPSKRHSKAK